MEDFVAESDLSCSDISMEINFSMLHRDSFCDILVKNVSAFGSCLKSLPKSKVKRFILIALTKEVSEMLNRDFVLWLSLMKNILKKHSKLRKDKYKIYGLSIKGAPGSEMELNRVQGEKEMKGVVT